MQQANREKGSAIFNFVFPVFHPLLLTNHYHNHYQSKEKMGDKGAFGLGRRFEFLMLVVLLCAPSYRVYASQRIRCVGKEKEALIMFKQGLNDEFDKLSSWGIQENQKECCEWRGVGCSNKTGYVTSIDLSSNSMGAYPVFIGNLTPAILDLHHLNYLDLSGSYFGRQLPDFLGSLTNLETLILAEVEFEDMVPQQLSYLTNLRTLDLRDNHLTSNNNLNWLSNLTSLSRLDLSGNKFVGSFSDLKGFFSLKELFLGGNKFTKLPIGIGQLRNLEILDVSRNSLQGLISEIHLSELHNLKHLDLSVNSLEGDISEAHFSELQNLIHLDLSFNSIEGSIPESYFLKLHHLKHLGLSFNSLRGIISENHLSNLQNLKYLGLSFNSLTLNLMPQWSPPFQLEDIRLANCSMGTHFPGWIRTQSSFSYLDLSCVNILGEVPNWLWDLSPQMSYLNLSNNQLTGQIPNLSSNFSNSAARDGNYISIDISSNNFSGHLPSFHPDSATLQLSNNMFSGTLQSFCGFKYNKLRYLDVSNNQLFGEIPNCWDMPQMYVLNLADNKFSGHLPPTFGSLSLLGTLDVRNNNLMGNLPSTMRNCQGLGLIDAGDNNLTGNVPEWIGDLTSLAFLILRSNNFSGRIPRELCHLTSMQVLDLSGNIISGRIPRCFTNFSSLVYDFESQTIFGPHPEYNGGDFYTPNDIYIDTALVHWKRQDREYKQTLGLLKLIDLSANKLVGNIPPELSVLRQLVSLNLSQNYLTGNIFLEIGEMEMLQCLDLSENQLFGEISIGLGKLHYLGILDLSNNSLSGKIPTGPQLSTFSAAVYAGNNNELCGQPLQMCEYDITPSPQLEKPYDTNDDKDYGFFSKHFFQENYISVVFGYIVGFWGIVGPLLYFGLLNKITGWLYMTLTKMRKVR